VQPHELVAVQAVDVLARSERDDLGHRDLEGVLLVRAPAEVVLHDLAHVRLALADQRVARVSLHASSQRRGARR
jgi:hypothetical protein